MTSNQLGDTMSNSRFMSRQLALDLRMPRSLPYATYATIARGFRRFKRCRYAD